MSAIETANTRTDPYHRLGWVPTDLYVDGRWRPSDEGVRFDVYDPATEEAIASVASASAADALRAVDAAHAALASWQAEAPRKRAEVLRGAYELLMERADQVAEVIVAENGKSTFDARAEVVYAAEFFRWYAEECVRLTGSVQRAPSGGNNIMVQHLPIGVSLLVTPWNFPAAMATRKIAPALAAGCTVVLKPAKETPLTALAIAAILAEAGVPSGVVNVLPSLESSTIVTAILDDPRVRKLSFTGSTEVGRTLLALAARSVVNCSMELGGNAPFIVLEDADLDLAVDGAMVAKMRNGGSACTAANRFLVHVDVAEEFSHRLAERMSALKVGRGTERDVDLGPLVNRNSLEKVKSLVEGAVDLGATALTGGHPLDGPGHFYPPTVLVDVPKDAPILDEEIFGPVAPITVFHDEDEAVAMANDTEYGLVAYLYTRDLHRALRITPQLHAGMIGINRGIVSDPAAPFGGHKQSGIGREGGHEGMLEFTESQYVAVDW